MKNIKIITLIFMITGCVFAISCKSKSKIPDPSQIINEWVDKTIRIPDIKPVYIQKKDTANVTDSTYYTLRKYKILIYIDSTGCTSCRLRAHTWKSYIEDMGSQADFLFFIQSKDKKAIMTLLKRERFTNYPVYIDTAGQLNQMNKLPDNPLHQCFLLDHNNKVLAMGDPISYPQVWELYKKIITGEMAEKLPVTTVIAERTEIKLNDLQTGKTSEAIFVLKNTGTEPLVIQQVESSCGCTVPDWEKQPVASGESTEIKVKITPEKSEYFNKTVTVHCNIEKGQISFTVKGEAK
jgi:hypothetical protein